MAYDTCWREEEFVKNIGLHGMIVGLCSVVTACAPSVRDYTSSGASSGQGGSGGSSVSGSSSSSSGVAGMGGSGGVGGVGGSGGMGGEGGGGTGGSPVELTCRGGNPACGASCKDGIKNQGETAIDCGGPCQACPSCISPSFTDAGLALAANEDARAVVARDLNGDSLPDVVIAGNMKAQIYINGGAGQGLQLAQTLGASSNAEQITTIDIDGDCDQDLVTLGYEAVVWMNDGTGLMTMLQSLGMPSQYVAGEVGVLDVDADGAPDLILPRHTGYDVWQNRMAALGIFVNSEQKPWNGCIAVAYGCRDKSPMFVARSNSETSTWLQTMGFTQTQIMAENGAYNYGVALGDMDGDGLADLVLGNEMAPAGVYTSDPTGVFNLTSTFGFKRYVRRLVLADFNTDGHLDVAMANWGNEPPSSCNPPSPDCPQRNEVWMNDGKGTMIDGKDFGRLASTYGLAAADMDGDGDQDLIAAEINAQAPLERSTRIYLNSCK